MIQFFRKTAALLLAGAVAAATFGCAAPAEVLPDDRVRIVATLFPQYDFARQIAGDKAEITLLLPPGVESHSYEPTPADIIQISNADLFLYTGEYMEPWAQTILDGVDPHGTVLDVTAGIPLLQEEEHADETHDEHAAHGGFDPHVWTDPRNAQTMTRAIADALCAADPPNAEFYRANERTYLALLDQLDQEIATIVATADKQEIVFGGRFALRYFAERYGLSYTAAFDSCSHESEPSVRVLATLIDKVASDGVPVIYHEELTDPKVARAIGEETGAELLLLHSCHNLSRAEFVRGETYLSLMWQNARNLKEGLNGWR